MSNTPRAIAIAALIIIIAIGGFVGWSFARILGSPLTIVEGGESFQIAPGTSFGAVADALQDRGIITNATPLRIYARWTDQAASIQAGEYLIAQGTTPRQLVKQFTSGAVRLYSFTIIEGWNQWDLLRALHDNPHIDASMSSEDWPALLEQLGANTAHPEGLFLPETYHFPRGTPDRGVLRQAYELMQKALAEEWENRSDDAIVATPYEALVLASIIEKETARADERTRISGVFTRRLKQRMRLQTDPTVIYGIGPTFNGNLTRKDLQTDTPYNTYTRHGLPPTPIAMPGRAAINAAVNPADGEELFFVATGLGDGSHKFSATKEEHDLAVAEYLRQLRKNRRSQ